MRWIVLATLAACGTTITETRLNPTPSNARRHAAQEVEMLASGPPARPHVDVAILIVSRQADPLDEALAELRATAGAMGCDALVVAPTGHVAAGMSPGQLSATCVVYTDATARR